MNERKRQSTTAAASIGSKRKKKGGDSHQPRISDFFSHAKADINPSPAALDEKLLRSSEAAIDSQAIFEGTEDDLRVAIAASLESHADFRDSAIYKPPLPHCETVSKIDCALDIAEFSTDELPSYWEKGQPTPYKWLVDAFVIMAATSKRLVKTTTLTNMFRMILRHSCDDLLAVLYLCMSEVGPSYEELELGIGPKILTKAIMNSSDASKQAIERQRRETGDWGDVAYNLRARSRFIRPKQLLARDVFHTLQVMPTMKGAGSEAQKTEKIVKILKHCEGEEIRFFVRTLVQHLRIGAVRNTILTALSHAVYLEFELPRAAAKNAFTKEQLTEAEEIVKEAYAQLPNLDILVPILLDPTIGLYNLREACRCAPGVPIRPMLGKITTGIDEVVQKFSGLAYCADYKYDGERAQIHCDSSGKVSVFSRNLKLSKKWADVHEFIPEIMAESTTSFIIDAEIVAIDDEGKIQPLQTLMNRQRKNGTLQTLKQKVYVCAFDLMYLNNQSLIKLDFRARREQLERAFRPVERKFCFVPQLRSDEMVSPEQLRRFFEQSLVDKAEGLMVKLLDTPPPTKTRVAYSATYEPDKRTDSWLKVKKEYDEGIMDTLDLVPIGAWRGSGRKKDFFSVFLLAAYNKETEMFETVCRCMTAPASNSAPGYDDPFLDDVTRRMVAKVDHEVSGSEKQSGTASKPLIVIERPKSYYLVKETPHVWLEPTEHDQVWEIKGGAITQSPVHTAGVTSMANGRGLSLRVPVFLRLRPDKTPEEATSTQEIIDLSVKQLNPGDGLENTFDVDEALASDAIESDDVDTLWSSGTT
ncbi:hypothetical protein HDU85_005312 [Gaertneriomyces sp. JEL0708]|nr:hypothetical protein HDU85_005312 [Gaertneriomyces sp. JEL0708]